MTLIRALPALATALLVFSTSLTATAGTKPKPDIQSALPSADVNSCMNACWYTYAQCNSSYAYTDCTDPYNQCVSYCRGYYDASRKAKPMPGPPVETPKP